MTGEVLPNPASERTRLNRRASRFFNVGAPDLETVTRNASDDELLRLVCKWVGVLALGEYEKVVDSLGYALAYKEAIPDPEVIRERIEGYLSPDYYPDETQFRVTDWRVASGGNPNRKKDGIIGDRPRFLSIHESSLPKLDTSLTRSSRFAPRHPPLERGRDLRFKPVAAQHVVAVGRRPDTVHRLLVHARLEQRPVGFAPRVLSSAKPQVFLVRSDQPVAPPIVVGVVARPPVVPRMLDHACPYGVALDVAVAGQYVASVWVRQERKRPSHNVPLLR